VKLGNTGLVLRRHFIFMVWLGLFLISEFPACGLRGDFWWRALSVFLVQEIIIKVLYLPLEVIIFLLLSRQEFVILIVDGVKHHSHFLGEELVNVVHKKSLREGHPLRHSSEIVLFIFIIIFVHPVSTLSNEVSITTLLN
jgi:hypothetical protein